jgi:tetratricopeptide (TPR) repeat protein
MAAAAAAAAAAMAADMDHIKLDPGASQEEVGEVCSALGRLYLARLGPAGEARQLLHAGAMLVVPPRDNPGEEALSPADLNGLGCYHRRCGRPKQALEHLHAALHQRAAPAMGLDVLTAASIHLNLGATLSELGNHRDALDQAQAALIAVQEDLYSTVNVPQRESLRRGAALLREALSLTEELVPDIITAAQRKIAAAEVAHFDEKILHATHLRRYDDVHRLKQMLHGARLRHAADAGRARRSDEEEVERLCEVLGLRPQLEQGAGVEEEQGAGGSDNGHAGARGGGGGDGGGSDAVAQWVEVRVMVLAMAYHNAGACQAAMQRHDAAMQSLIHGLELVRAVHRRGGGRGRGDGGGGGAGGEQPFLSLHRSTSRG